MTQIEPMAQTEDLFNDERVSILVIGDAGTHKTFLAGGAPAPFIFDFDANLAVLRPKVEAGLVGVGRFKEASPKTPKIANAARGIYEWGTAYSAFLKKLDQIGESIDNGTCPYRTLVFDSLTTFSNIVLSAVIRGTSGGNGANSANPYGVIDPGQWGQQIRLMEGIFDMLTGWPLNLVVTAHIQRDINTATTQGVEYLPLVTGKFAGKIGIYFNEVWYTQVIGVDKARKYTLLTESEGSYKQAKTTNGVPKGTEASWEKVAGYFPEAAR